MKQSLDIAIKNKTKQNKRKKNFLVSFYPSKLSSNYFYTFLDEVCFCKEHALLS